MLLLPTNEIVGLVDHELTVSVDEELSGLSINTQHMVALAINFVAIVESETTMIDVECSAISLIPSEAKYFKAQADGHRPSFDSRCPGSGARSSLARPQDT